MSSAARRAPKFNAHATACLVPSVYRWQFKAKVMHSRVDMSGSL